MTHYAHLWTDNSTDKELWFISVTQHNHFESIIPILQGKLAFKTVIYTSKVLKRCTLAALTEIQKSFSCIKYFKLQQKIQRTNHWIGAFVTVLYCLHSGSISVHENRHGQAQNRPLVRCYPELSQYLGRFLEINKPGSTGLDNLHFCHMVFNTSSAALPKHCNCGVMRANADRRTLPTSGSSCAMSSHLKHTKEVTLPFHSSPQSWLILHRYFARNTHFQTKLTQSHAFGSTWMTTAALGNLHSLQQIQSTPAFQHRCVRTCRTGGYPDWIEYSVQRGEFSLLRHVQ